MELPTKEQIRAIDDVEALICLRDDVEDAIIAVETQLENRDDPDWARRATTALFYHRQCRRALTSRINKLTDEDRKSLPIRPPEDNSPVTNAALDCLPVIDLPAIQTTEQADTLMSRLQEIADAMEIDRNSEVALIPIERDEVFIGAVNIAIRRVRALRQEVMMRRGEIRRARKQAETDQREAVRERVFIEVARKTLPAEAYRALWDAVDRQLIENQMEMAA